GHRERLAYRSKLAAVRRLRPVAEVGLLEQHAAAYAAERHDARVAQLTAIEPDRVRAEPGANRLEIEEAPALAARPRPLGQLEQELARPSIEPGDEQTRPPRGRPGLLGERVGRLRVPGARGR